MRQLSRLVKLTPLVLGLALIAPPTVAAQSAYVGTWALVPTTTVGHIPGLPPASELEIGISGDQLTARKDQAPTEIYRRDDGIETDLSEYRKGRLSVNDAALNLTTVRVRPGSDTVTIVSDVYAATGDVLLVTRTLRVERPSGVLVDTPQNRWEAHYTRR